MGELILNAVALEFILHLGAVMHFAMAPMRNRRAVEETKMLPVQRITVTDYRQLAYVCGLIAVTLGWVCCYMWYFQGVLPDYRWDVHEVCEIWIAERYAV